MKRSARDSGSVSVEMAILTPAFAMMLAFVVLAGRMQSSRADIEAAAHAAARSITLARDTETETAVPRAHEDAQARLRVGSASCRDMGWDVQRTPQDVTVTITCTVDVTEASLLPIPGTITIEATSTEVVDRFRETG